MLTIAGASALRATLRPAPRHPISSDIEKRDIALTTAPAIANIVNVPVSNVDWNPSL